MLDLELMLRHTKWVKTLSRYNSVDIINSGTSQTVELAQLQVGDNGDIRLVVSTVAEVEHFWEWLLHCYKTGRSVDVSK